MEHPNRLEALIDTHTNTLYRTALAILGNPAEAEDAVQDTFLRYLETRPQLRDSEHEKAWLLRVIINACRSRLRAAKRHPLTELLASYPAHGPDSWPAVRWWRRCWPCRPGNERRSTCFTTRGTPPRRSPPSPASGRGRCAPI